ncbi:MAG: NAD(P)H-dependent oxidoreductase subunit E [Lentisphaerales bacterium]|nr:NAD(P)H-dependent oxidoreductase subunit E [Lentisphaerales bacterium]
MSKKAVVFIGHGSRRGNSNENFEALVEAYQDFTPDVKVYHGYIELAKPFMGDAIRQAAEESSEVTVMPLLLFRAGHAKNDIPLVLDEVRKEFPNVNFKAADVLGPHPKMAQLAFLRGTETGLLSESSDNSDTAVVFIGRGSSDPDANSDFYKQSRSFSEGRGFQWVLPCFIGITEPKLQEALELMARIKPKKLLVIPYFLLTGVLIERIQQQVEEFNRDFPWVKAKMAPPLEAHNLLFETITDRLSQAEDKSYNLACDGCRYRVPLPKQEDHLGGLKALLMSQRHTFTHNQAMPQEHTHKPIKKHVLVCGNVDCVDKGAIKTLACLRNELKKCGKNKEIIVTRTSCMGRCGEGPTMAVYPDGIWYKEVQADDIEELVETHLIGDKLVPRLIDDIMS